MRIELPDPCLVVLVGASSSGKSTFAARHFPSTSVLSSDAFRAMLVDDENSLVVNEEAFDALHYMAHKRLRLMRLTVVDATNVQREWRAPLVRIAKENDLLTVAIVFNTPQRECLERNAAREDRTIPEGAIRRHCRLARRATVKALKREGFRYTYVVRPEDEVEVARTPLYSNRPEERGPFDIVGDVHGCFEELVELVSALGYVVKDGRVIEVPPGRRLFFVGDLCDRGPDSPAVLSLVMDAVEDGFALCVPGNHDAKLQRVLAGKKATLSHGLDLTMQQLEATRDDAFRARARDFIRGLVSHLVVDDGKLVVAHAGMKEEFQGRSSGRVRAFALYGDTTGKKDEYGLPIRLDWGADYRGEAAVVYGHTPVYRPQWVNNTINIDTGCAFGGALTALRWPERKLVSVPARETYAESPKPIAPPEIGKQLPPDVAELTGHLRVDTRHGGLLTVRPEFCAAALEVMSRFAVNPRWMPYLPPTMSPVETSFAEGFLERPEEAFMFYANAGVEEVVCQEKHMGSRAVVVVARDGDAARQRFDEHTDRLGVVYTRTGRPFFGTDDDREGVVVARVSAALHTAGIWDELDADWICLDAELMPWSLKARQLLGSQ
jgi:protein phosphatase